MPRKKKADTPKPIETKEISHSYIGASAAHRWLKCPGSVKLARQVPNQSSEYADEGTAAHEICARALAEGREAWEFAGDTVRVGEKDWPVTDEMVESVQLYLDTIANDAQKGAEVLVEHKFSLIDVHEDLYGTSDCVVFDEKRNGGHLFVYDFKYGVGVAVDAENNEQLMTYAAGAVSEFTRKNPDACINHVELVIVQPRADHPDGPVRRWTLTLDSLGEWVGAVLEPGAKATDADDAPLADGDHCQFCPAKVICPLLTGKFDAAVSEAEAKTDFTKLEDWELAERLAKVKSIRSYLKALEDETFSRLMKGKEVPGFKLVQKKSNRVWRDGAEKIVAGALGDAAYERKFRSPAQVERLKGGRELAQEHAYKPDTGLTLADDSDNRSAVPVRTAADAFAGV